MICIDSPVFVWYDLYQSTNRSPARDFEARRLAEGRGVQRRACAATVEMAARPAAGGPGRSTGSNRDDSDVKFNLKYFSAVYTTCSELMHCLAWRRQRPWLASAAARARSDSRVPGPGWVEASAQTMWSPPPSQSRMSANDSQCELAIMIMIVRTS